MSLTIATKEARAFLLALSFLSRLGSSVAASDEDMNRAVAYYPLVGFILGFIQLLPVFLDIWNGNEWVQAWAYVLLGIWLTRGLHLDGLADISDALGGSYDREKFWTIIKDSRIGAFGAIALASVIAGQIVLAAALIQQGTIAPLLFAPVLGRTIPLFLSMTTRPHSTTGLGVLVANAPRRRSLFLALAALIPTGLFCLGVKNFLISLVLGCVLVFFLARIARKYGGYNGDFFGCAIVIGELLPLAATLL